MNKKKLTNKEMLKLMVFFLMLFAPITVNADEPADTSTDSNSESEEASDTQNTSNEKEEITDTTATFTGSYDTEEEANSRKDEKETEYQEAGYENIQSEITSVTTSDEEEITIDRTFDDKEDADSLLEQFMDTYPDAEGEVTEIRTDEVIDTTTGTTPYDTEEAAQAALDDYIANNETDAHYFEGEVTGPTATGDYTTPENISETFDNEDAADSYVSELEADGYIVENTEFTHDTETTDGSIDQDYETEDEAEAALETFKSEYPDDLESLIESIVAGTVNDSTNLTTITRDMKLYQVGSTAYVIIKRGNEIIVWTEDELTDEEIEQFRASYAEVAEANHETVITGDVINQNSVRFLNGYGTFKTGNNKKITVSEEEDGIRIQTDPGAVSRLLYGEYEPETKYHLTASGTKTTELDSGTLTGTKKKEILGYYFNTTKKAKKWHLKATATDVVETTTYYLTVKADIPQEKTKKANAVVEENVVNPQTSDSVMKYATLLTLSVGISVIGCLALRSKRKRFN